MSRTEIMKLMRKIEKYVEQAMEQAVYDKLEDGTFAGRIPSYKETEGKLNSSEDGKVNYPAANGL